jgi:hypothetical protein
MPVFATMYPCKGGKLMDIVYIGITVVLFVASWFFVKLVERV